MAFAIEDVYNSYGNPYGLSNDDMNLPYSPRYRYFYSKYFEIQNNQIILDKIHLFSSTIGLRFIHKKDDLMGFQRRLII